MLFHSSFFFLVSMSTKSFLSLALCLLFLIHGVASINYLEALTKSLLYYESQRSGKLPANQRVTWRGDSGLKDGSDAGVDLVGGYHDAGDNVKFGFPMAYTITMLSWSVVEFQGSLTKNSELANALRAIKWGTDYLLKAHPEPNVLYGQVGEGDADHECWERPEDMTTPRTSYKIDEDNPGSDLAGETSAALAAASIVFKSVDPKYATELLTHSKQLFDFASNYQDQYQNSIPSAGEFYSSSGFQDELLWAAAWLHRATGEQTYLDVLGDAEDTGGFRTMFSWDDKFAGVQLLVAKLVLDGKVPGSGIWTDKYKGMVEEFICNCLQKGHNNFKITPGGMLYWLPWNDLQYTTAAVFLATVYSDYLAASNATFLCRGGVVVQPAELITFAQSQVDHILGLNPKNMSYMVGFGTNYPTQVHHRGASIVSIKKDSTPVTCKGGYDTWYNKNATDPNVLTGAIVGGPDQSDSYTDSRSNYNQAEPATASTAPLVGVLARLV